MTFYAFNIGKPYNNEWWLRHLHLGIITTGFDGQPRDRGETILRQLKEGDWVLGYANGYGFVGAGRVGAESSYRLVPEADLPVDWESNHRHRRDVNWVHALQDLSKGIPATLAEHHAPRRTKEKLPEDIGNRLVRLLTERTQQETPNKTLARLRDDFSQSVSLAALDSPETRQARLRNAPTTPRKVPVLSYEFVRNPDVVAETLFRAQGNCEHCRRAAPFMRRTDGSPYLEVHHKTPLSQGGQDTVANAMAVCPNCHRELHHGKSTA